MFFCKQRTAYEVRISDWSSDVCSSGLRAAVFLNDYARTSDPFAAIGIRSVSVQVTSVVRASDSSFQVKWTEQVYERGSLARTERWTAILTTVIQPPRSARSEEHTSELQSLMRISYAVFCLKKKINQQQKHITHYN